MYTSFLCSFNSWLSTTLKDKIFDYSKLTGTPNCDFFLCLKVQFSSASNHKQSNLKIQKDEINSKDIQIKKIESFLLEANALDLRLKQYQTKI